jgi:hypothetical protein
VSITTKDEIAREMAERTFVSSRPPGADLLGSAEPDPLPY